MMTNKLINPGVKGGKSEVVGFRNREEGVGLRGNKTPFLPT